MDRRWSPVPERSRERTPESPSPTESIERIKVADRSKWPFRSRRKCRRGRRSRNTAKSISSKTSCSRTTSTTTTASSACYRDLISTTSREMAGWGSWGYRRLGRVLKRLRGGRGRGQIPWFRFEPRCGLSCSPDSSDEEKPSSETKAGMERPSDSILN